MNRMQGKVAVVTGGALRVGRATALLLAREGAAVAVLDIEDAAGEAAVAEIKQAGGNARYWHLDVSQEEEVTRVFGEIRAQFGRVDVLVNNANVGGPDSPTDTVTEAQWDSVMAINVKGVLFCTKHAIPLMRHAGAGSVVNISSIYGLVSSPHLAPYHASMGAVRIMTKSTPWPTPTISFASTPCCRASSGTTPWPSRTGWRRRWPTTPCRGSIRWAAWANRPTSPMACFSSPRTKRSSSPAPNW